MKENEALSLPEIIRRLREDFAFLRPQANRRSAQVSIEALEAIEQQARGVLDSVSDMKLPPVSGALLTELLDTLTDLHGEIGGNI